MDNNTANVTTTESKELKRYQMLLNNVFAQKLQENEKQMKIWNDYKDRHQKVIEGLQIYPLYVSKNCMVPIGKQALMKGKLTHTNEILVCLGDSYFAKYSASQAISLCNRRIAQVDEMLKKLETERNLYEMRQSFPLKHDIFGEDNREEILEHWTEDKLDDWKIQHREREKQYHQKLAKLREKEKTDTCTEDLFKRLDELELEEELENEILEVERKNFYGDDLKEGEVYDESEEDTSDSDESTSKIIEELKKLKDIKDSEVVSNISNASSDATQDEMLDINVRKDEQSNLIVNSTQEKLRTNCSSETGNTSEDTNIKERRRVSFVEPCAIEDESNTNETSVSQEACSILKQDDTSNENSEDEDCTIRIEFSHSSHTPSISESNTELQTPADIYRMFSAPKSILKRSPNDMIPNPIPPLNQDSSEEAENDDCITYSAFNSVIKENVEETKTLPVNDTSMKKDQKKIVSRFKLERAKKSK